MASLASGPSLTSNNKTNSTVTHQHAVASHLSTPQILTLLSNARESLTTKSLPPRDYAPERFVDLVSPRREASLADTRASSLAFFYRRQWRLATAYNVVKAVRTSILGKRNRDTNWRVNSITAAIRTFWSSSAAMSTWPPTLAQFKATYDAVTADKTPAAVELVGATAKKRGRSPSAAKSGRDKRRRRLASEDFLAVATTGHPQKVNVDASCVAFGRLEGGTRLSEDLPMHSSIENEELRDYAFRLLQFLLRDIIGDQKCVKRVFSAGDSSEYGGRNRGSHAGVLSTPRALSESTWIVPREDALDWPPPVDALTQGASTVLTIPVPASIKSVGYLPRKMKDLACSAYPVLSDAVTFPSTPYKGLSLRSTIPSFEDLQVIEVFGSENSSGSHRAGTDGAAFLQNRTVSCEKSYTLGSDGIKVDVLTKPLTTTSWAALHQKLPLDDVRLLIAVSLAGTTWSKEASDLLTALKVLNKFSQLKRGSGLRLNDVLRTSITQYALSLKVTEDMGPLDDIIPLSQTIMQEYVAGVLMKSHQASEWIRRLGSECTQFHLVTGDIWEVKTGPDSGGVAPGGGAEVTENRYSIDLSLDSLHFFARRHNKRKWRATGTPTAAGVYPSMTYADEKKQRSSGFVLEQALQMTTEKSGLSTNAQSSQQTRYKPLITRLPKWAVIFHRILIAGPLSDLWELTLPLLSSFNQIGGALVAPLTNKSDKPADLLARFLPLEQCAAQRPLLFARMSRLLPTATESPPEAGPVTVRAAKYHIGNHSLSDAPILASHQIAYPTVLSIKAATRTVRRIDTAWDPIEEIFLWRYVMIQQKPLLLGIERLDEENVLRVLDSVKRELDCSKSHYLGDDPDAADLLSRIDWKLVAHGVNVVMAPFSRCRSPEACKAKFVSLLFENLLAVLACPQRSPPNNQESLSSPACQSNCLCWEERLISVLESSQDEFRPCGLREVCHNSKVDVRLKTKKLRVFSSEFPTFLRNIEDNVAAASTYCEALPGEARAGEALSDAPHQLGTVSAQQPHDPGAVAAGSIPGPDLMVDAVEGSPIEDVSVMDLAAEDDMNDASSQLDDLLRDIRASQTRASREEMKDDDGRGTMVEVVTSIVPAHEWQRWSDEQLLDCLFDQKANEEDKPPVQSKRLKALVDSEVHQQVYKDRSWIVQLGHGRRLKPLKDIWLSCTSAKLQKTSSIKVPDRLRREGSREDWERLSKLVDMCSDVQPVLTSEEKNETFDRGTISNTLDKVVPYFQLGKAIFHYRTQGLLSLSSYYTLQPAGSKGDGQLNLSLINALRSLVVLGSCCNQSLRLVKHLIHLQYQTEKRRRMSGLSQYHENFATDKSLQQHLCNSPACLPILKAMRDKRVAKELEQPGTDPKSASIVQATALSYHRLLLPVHDSQRRSQTETKQINDSIPLELLIHGPLTSLFISSRSLATPTAEEADIILPDAIAGPVKALAAIVSDGGTVLLRRKPLSPKFPQYLSSLDLKRLPFPKSLNAGALVEKMQQLVAKSEIVSNAARHQMPSHPPQTAEAAGMSSDVGGGRRRGNLMSANGMNVMQQSRSSNPKMPAYVPPTSRVPPGVAAMAGSRMGPGMGDHGRGPGLPTAVGQWREVASAAATGQMGAYKNPGLMSGMPSSPYGQMPSMYGMPYSQAAPPPTTAWSQSAGNAVGHRYATAGGGGQAAWGYMAASPSQTAGRGAYGGPPYAGVDYSQMYRNASRYAQAGDSNYARRGQTYMRSDAGSAAYGGDSNYYGGVPMDMSYHAYINPSGNNNSSSYVWPRPQ